MLQLQLLLLLLLLLTNITVIVKAPTFIIIIIRHSRHLLISPVIIPISISISRCRRCMTWSLASHSLTSLIRVLMSVSTFSN